MTSYLTKLKSLIITFKSWSVRGHKKNTCRNNLFAGKFACFRGHSCMRMAIETRPGRLQLQISRNIADVFSELAIHTESKMIIFMSGPLLNHSQAHPSQRRPFSRENYCLYRETDTVSISF